MGKKEKVSCLFVEGGSLPDDVREKLIDELCKMKPGEKNTEFVVGGLVCNLLLPWDYWYTSLGSIASGFMCMLIINQLKFKAIFLADVDLVGERKPPQKGALIVPVCRCEKTV